MWWMGKGVAKRRRERLVEGSGVLETARGVRRSNLVKIVFGSWPRSKVVNRGSRLVVFPRSRIPSGDEGGELLGESRIRLSERTWAFLEGLGYGRRGPDERTRAG